MVGARTMFLGMGGWDRWGGGVLCRITVWRGCSGEVEGRI